MIESFYTNSFVVIYFVVYNKFGNKNMNRGIIRLIYLTILFISLMCLFGSNIVNASTSTLYIIKVEGTIIPVVANYIDRSITAAEQSGSTACIIELSTPGGLLDSTEKIVQRILNAKVPVVVYVSPQGAWAASAGTFLTVAAHIAVMSPGTTIGAAHPVSVGEQQPAAVIEKTTKYSAAWIRSIAEKRGKNPVESELAVTESKSFTAAEALKNNLIDFIADDMNDLVDKLQDKKVILANGKEVLLATRNAVSIKAEMNLIERFLHSITDPNIAYILLGLATIGLFTEITNPGLIFPGVTGGICLFLSLYSLGTLNAYWAGLLLIMLAFGLFIAELFTSVSGILTTGGIISLIIGSLLLFINNPPALQINPVLIVVVVIILVAFFIFMVGAVIHGQRRRIETGAEGIIGKIGLVKAKLSPRGTIMVEGELWNAVVEQGQANQGEEVVVEKIDGLKLTVTRKKNGKE